MTMTSEPVRFFTPTRGQAGVFSRATARLVLLTLLFHLPDFTLVPVGVFVGAVLIFVAFPFLRTRRLRFLVWGALVALACGVILRTLPAVETAVPTDAWTALTLVVWVLAFPFTVAAGMWALDITGPRTGLILVVAGAIAAQLLQGGFGWKGTTGIYITVLVLLVFARSLWLTSLALLAVAALSAAEDARSMAIVALLTLGLMFLTRAPRPKRGEVEPTQRSRTGTVRTLLLIAAGALLLVWALTQGFFGEGLQRRTLRQLENPATIFGGARVEFTATFLMAGRNPFGYGMGVQPGSTDIAAGIESVRLAGGDWASSYFIDNVFGTRVDLHSMTANLWFHFGLAGLLFGVAVIVFLLQGIAPAARASRPLLGMAGPFAILIALWDMMFSPMGNVDRVLLGILFAAVAMRMNGQLVIPVGAKPRPTPIKPALAR